jgi:cobaltochelatase CobS
MGKICWLATENGFDKAEIVEEVKGFRKVKRTGADDRIEAIPIGTPHNGFFPALYEQDEEPKVWSHKGRSLPLADLAGFPNAAQAGAILRTNQSFDENGGIKPYVFQPHTLPVIDGIITGDHVFLIGAKGTGKTSCVEQVAARVGQPVVRVNFTGQISVSDIVGSMGFGPSGTYWNDGPVITAMRNGYWLLLDEFDFGDPSVLSIFHPILEARPSYCLKENNGEIVVAKPGFRVFATGNSISGDKDGQYVGTQALNAALLDRFTGHGSVVEIKAMSARQEREVVLALLPDLPYRIAKRACDFAADMRSKHLKGFSTRELLNWCKKILLTRDATKAARLTFLSVIQNDGVRKGVEEAIRARFGSRVIIGRCIMDGTRTPPAFGRRRARPKAEAGAPVETPTAEVEAPEVVAETKETPEAPEAAPNPGERTSSQVTDADEISAICKDYKGNGGMLSFAEIEAKYGLKSSKGMNAYRIVKAKDKKESVEPDADEDAVAVAVAGPETPDEDADGDDADADTEEEDAE